MTCIRDFRDYVTASNWEAEWATVLTALPRDVEEFRLDRLQLSRIRQSWRVANTTLEGESEKSRSVTDVERDAPLPEPKQKSSGSRGRTATASRYGFS